MNGDNIVKVLEKSIEEAIKFIEKEKESPFNKDDPWFEGHLEAFKNIRKEINTLKAAPNPTE